MEYNFTGQTILVTGGARGIGRGVCEKLVKCGAKVIALDQLKPELDDLVRKYPEIVPIQVDLGNWTETRKALANVGRVNGLVNNAGIEMNRPFFEITEHEYDKTFNVNTKAIINVTQMIAKGMVERKKGSIVNVASTSEVKGYEDHAVYCGSKAAVGGITRVLALELGRHNVRANCVNPTVVLTAMGINVWSDPSKGDGMKQRIPMGRFAEVEEIVNVILFLLSDSSSMVNGVSLLVDGGHQASPYYCSK